MKENKATRVLVEGLSWARSNLTNCEMELDKTREKITRLEGHIAEYKQAIIELEEALEKLS